MTEVRDREFDWFCIDRKGHFAVLATGGCGHVPGGVLPDVHDRLGDSIPVADWGTEGVWRSYTVVGLYIYDWNARKGAYVRLAKPGVPVALELAAAIEHAGVPRLDVDFEHDDAIHIP